MNTNSKFFEDLLKILAAGSVFLVLFGVLDAASYFGRFNISILEYISTSEILLITINNSGFLFFSFLIQLFIWLLVFKKRLRKHPVRYRLPKFKRGEVVWVSLAVLVLSSISVLPAAYSIKLQISILIIMIIAIISITIFFLALTPAIFESLLEDMKVAQAKLWTATIIFSASIAMMIVIKNMIAFNTINRKGNSDNIVIVTTTGDTLRQSNSIRYVGRTQGYFYYWNKETHTTTAIPASEIKTVVIGMPFYRKLIEF